MKTNLRRNLLWLLATLLIVPATAGAQTLKRPTAPTPIDVCERTIKDFLYYPFACIDADLSTLDEAQRQVAAAFGTCENVNGGPGIHQGDAFNFTYRNVPIGVAYFDHYDNRMWYSFYFDTKADADRFYKLLAADIKKAGIPLVADNIYGGLSNRKRPVSIFKWVYVIPAAKVKEANASNINRPESVGKYFVEFGVYKRPLRK